MSTTGRVSADSDVVVMPTPTNAASQPVTIRFFFMVALFSVLS
jgi:hypothetical protein